MYILKHCVFKQEEITRRNCGKTGKKIYVYYLLFIIEHGTRRSSE